jgi:predicted RNase H-like HicB family nuclease
MKFKVILEEDEDGWFVVTVPSLPGCISQGKTKEEALENIKEAIELHLTSLAEEGIPLKPSKKISETTVAVEI